MNEVWAIVLAAGLSTRMGTQKLLLPFDDKTIVEKTLENILNSGIENIVVVLGANHSEIREVLNLLPVQTVINDQFKDGMHTSIIAGVKALPDDAKAVMIFLGDQPFIPPITIQNVIDAWNTSGKSIIIPLCDGKRGHPPLYDTSLRDEILNLDREVGLRSVALKFPDKICEVETFCPTIVRDIDTPEEYLRELNYSQTK
jgi:CTP:molybdopterin cytidylyltransferase MocA